MGEWKRNDAPIGTKGLDIHVDYVRVEVKQFCPPIVEYLPSYATQHWMDSHGSTDVLETSAAGTVKEWMTAITCSGTQLFVYYTTFWLVTGTPPGSDDYPTSLFRWDRNVVNDPTKGVTCLDVILLPFWPPHEEDAEECEIFEDDCYSIGDPGKRRAIGQPGTPVCWPTRRCGVAKSGRLYFDSHGNLDKIESWPIPGLQQTMIESANIVSEECVEGEDIDCPEGEHPIGNSWRVEYKSRNIILHPGSVPLGTRVEVFECCECCECIDNCALPCDLAWSVFFDCTLDQAGICIKRELVFIVGISGTNCTADTIEIPVTWDGTCWTGSKTFQDQAGNTRTWDATACFACTPTSCWVLSLVESDFIAGGCPTGGLSPPASCNGLCTWCPVNETCAAGTAFNYCKPSVICVDADLTFFLVE